MGYSPQGRKESDVTEGTEPTHACSGGKKVYSTEMLNSLLFTYLFWAALGLCCYTGASSSCREWGLPSIVLSRLLTVVASLAEEPGL